MIMLDLLNREPFEWQRHTKATRPEIHQQPERSGKDRGVFYILFSVHYSALFKLDNLIFAKLDALIETLIPFIDWLPRSCVHFIFFGITTGPR